MTGSRYLSLILLCLGLYAQGLSVQAQQSASSELQQLAQLNQSGQARQAYAMATRMLPQWEGDPAFDLQYGLAAVDSGMFSEGIFALERVLMSQPRNDYARLELARAYFAAREDDRARREFERVLANNPPREVRDNILPYLDTIKAREGERRTSWTASAEMTAGYDSNINASPDSDSFFIPLLGGVATLASSSTEDSFIRASAMGGVTRPLTRVSQLFGSATFEHRANSSGDIDTTSLGLQGGYNRNYSWGSVRVALQGNHFRVDNDEYRNLLGLTASGRYVMSPMTSLNVSMQYSDLAYPDLPNRDARLLMASAGAQHQLLARYRPTLSFSVSAGKEDARRTTQASQANTERDILGASAGLRLSFNSALQLNTSLQWQQSRYAGTEALFQRKREDKGLTGAASLLWRASDNWLLNLSGSLTDNDSNIPITDYQRNQISVGARYLLQ